MPHLKNVDRYISYFHIDRDEMRYLFKTLYYFHINIQMLYENMSFVMKFKDNESTIRRKEKNAIYGN